MGSHRREKGGTTHPPYRCITELVTFAFGYDHRVRAAYRGVNRRIRAWEETREAYHARLKACAGHINGHFDVEALCRGLPGRVAELAARRGDRLCK